MSPDLTAKFLEWKYARPKSLMNPSLALKRPKLRLLLQEKSFRPPCKWMRPLNDFYVGCWNKEKVDSILKEHSNGAGVLQINDRKFCRGADEDMPDCWEGLRQDCIDNCTHYCKGISKYNHLKGFCGEQCHSFELYKREIKFARTKVIKFE